MPACPGGRCIAAPAVACGSPAPLHADRIAADIKARLRACRQPAPAALWPADEYAPGLAARFHLVAEAPPEPFRPAPVKAQVARFDPSALIRFPPLVARWLAMMKAVKAANQSRVAEVAER